MKHFDEMDPGWHVLYAAARENYEFSKIGGWPSSPVNAQVLPRGLKSAHYVFQVSDNWATEFAWLPTSGLRRAGFYRKPGTDKWFMYLGGP